MPSATDSHSHLPIVLRMTGYANGGDADWDQSSTHASSWLNEGSTSHLTGGEIAAIVIIFVLLLALTLSIFYLRTLRARRDIDMANKKALRMARVIPCQLRTLSVTSSAGSSVTRPDTTELRPKGQTQSHSSTAAPNADEITPIPASTAQVASILRLPPRAVLISPRRLEAGNYDTDRAPLWHYVRWRDPFNGKYAVMPTRPRPRRVPAGELIVPPRPPPPPLFFSSCLGYPSCKYPIGMHDANKTVLAQ